MIEIWMDASSQDGRSVGAFIVQCGELVRPVKAVQLPNGLQGTYAELALMEEVIRRYPCQSVIHHDVRQLPQMIAKGRQPAAKIGWLVGKFGIDLRSDGRNFRQYRACHHAARCVLGIYGTEHPLRKEHITEEERKRIERLVQIRERNKKLVLRGGLGS